MDLEFLKQRAINACVSRGHKLRAWKILHTDARSTAHSSCVCCGRWIRCDSNPLPNSAPLAGDALALQCVKAKEAA